MNLVAERQSGVCEGLGVVTRQRGRIEPRHNPRSCKTSRHQF
jgi:hypothetical protein